MNTKILVTPYILKGTSRGKRETVSKTGLSIILALILIKKIQILFVGINSVFYIEAQIILRMIEWEERDVYSRPRNHDVAPNSFLIDFFFCRPCFFRREEYQHYIH